MWFKKCLSSMEGSTVRTSFPSNSDAKFPRISPRGSFYMSSLSYISVQGCFMHSLVHLSAVTLSVCK